MEKSHKRWMGVGTIILIIALWSAFLYYFSPDEIVESIGLSNAYLIVFLVAAIGGLSTLTGTSLFVAIAALASGGANPWILGLVGGLGIFISDTIFFYVIRYGLTTFDESDLQKRATYWADKLPKRLVPVGVFFWTGFTPLPNDVLMLVLNVIRTPYRTVAIPILLGSICIATLTAHFGQSIPWLN